MFGHIRTIFGHIRIYSDHIRTYSDIFGHIRTIFGHVRTYSDHFRTYSDNIRTYSDHIRTQVGRGCVSDFETKKQDFDLPIFGRIRTIFGHIRASRVVQGGPKVDFSIDVCSGIGGQEFIRGFPGFRGFPGSGVRSRSSDPPLHTRRSLRMT